VKKKMIAVFVGGLLAVSDVALARDNVLHLPLADVLAMPEAQGKLDGSVSFYLSGAAHPSVVKTLGDDVANKKTNGLGKSDDKACRWAALAALLAFQESAKKQGANAVINLVSYYKRQTFESPTEYECHAGGVVVGVALKGDYATVGH
jgi:uncharacterized protein YbjQ (UPF0145 family)